MICSLSRRPRLCKLCVRDIRFFSLRDLQSHSLSIINDTTQISAKSDQSVSLQSIYPKAQQPRLKAAVECVTNARNTLNSYKDFLMNVKYKGWNDSEKKRIADALSWEKLIAEWTVDWMGSSFTLAMATTRRVSLPSGIIVWCVTRHLGAGPSIIWQRRLLQHQQGLQSFQMWCGSGISINLPKTGATFRPKKRESAARFDSRCSMNCY